MDEKYDVEKKYQSEALMVCHQSAESLFQLGIIDADEMREYDKDCLVQEAEIEQPAEKPTEYAKAGA